ncbi:hypothetical protein BDZ89DRAFT_490114 [Hymenopellis radicata]|nr:hypothetical protein BDZ89DRAFT_490114 [Hymenopellis radicata]
MDAIGIYGSDDSASVDGGGPNEGDHLLAPVIPLTEPPSTNNISNVDNMMDLDNDLDDDPLDTLSWGHLPSASTLVSQSSTAVPTSSSSHSSSSSFVFYIPPSPQILAPAPSSTSTSVTRRMETASGTVSTYRRMVHAISDGDVKRVDAVLRVAIRHNASPNEILGWGVFKHVASDPFHHHHR